LLYAEVGDKREPASLSDLAVDPDPSAHQLRELRRNREAEARASVAASGGGIGLYERAEDFPLFLLRNADAGVGYHEPQPHRGIRPVVDHDVGDHFAAVRELDGVAHQIDQHLTQASRVAHERIGNVRSNAAGELEALRIRARSQQSNGILYDVAEREWDLFERQLPRLDLREIENVVDERREEPRSSL
jgi:hypothetical protein